MARTLLPYTCVSPLPVKDANIIVSQFLESVFDDSLDTAALSLLDVVFDRCYAVMGEKEAHFLVTALLEQIQSPVSSTSLVLVHRILDQGMLSYTSFPSMFFYEVFLEVREPKTDSSLVERLFVSEIDALMGDVIHHLYRDRSVSKDETADIVAVTAMLHLTQALDVAIAHGLDLTSSILCPFDDQPDNVVPCVIPVVSTRILRKLIENGAPLDLGIIALACANDRPVSIIKTLVEHDASVHERYRNRHALYYTVTSLHGTLNPIKDADLVVEKENVVRYLLQQGVPTSSVEFVHAVFHTLVEGGTLIRPLLEASAVPQRAMNVAVAHRCPIHVLQFLVSRGGDLNEIIGDQGPPILAYVEKYSILHRGDLYLQRLLSLGCDIRRENPIRQISASSYFESPSITL